MEHFDSCSGWDDLVAQFPDGFEQMADSLNTMKGSRQDKDLLNAIRTLFMHLGLGFSLKETAVRAHMAGLCNMSSVALFGRLRKFGPLFKEMCDALLKENRLFLEDAAERFRLIDATDIQEPGSTGSSWRFHYSFLLPSMVCDFTKLTSNKGKGAGETLVHFPIHDGDLVIADRGYSNSRGISHVKNNGGEVCIRLNHRSLPLLKQDGSPFNLSKWLKKLKKPGDAAESDCCIRNFDSDQFWDGRICAIRKDEEAIEKSLKRLRKVEKQKRRERERKNYSITQETIFLSQYILIFTTFPREEYPLRRILEIYRWRWQIELVFKRFKSLLELGHLPKTTTASAQAWLYGKLLIALLIEKINARNGAFSPWRDEIRCEEKQSLAYLRFCLACCPAMDIASIQL